MKKLIFILPLLFLGINTKAQQYYQLYYNQELQQQVTLNHSMRMLYEEFSEDTYRKQAEAYAEARNKITQVVVMKDNIYNQLRNVNSALKQGKQLQYLYQDFNKLIGNMGTMLDLTVSKPQYAILINRFYQRIFLHATQAYEGVQDQVLREEADYLMDSYDRQYVLNKLHREIKIMNAWVLHINNYLKNADKKPYFRHIRVLNTWYIQDKAMIERIIRNSNNLSNW